MHMLLTVLLLSVLLTAAALTNCTQYANRSFISEEDMVKRVPPLLLSYPGSGNSWTRMLVEYATGYFTGTIFPPDVAFGDVYASEKYCGLRQVAIKAHPSYVTLRKDKTRKNITNPFDVMMLTGSRKCKKGLIFSFKRVLLLIRDPFDAILATYNLDRTGNHSGVLSADSFDVKDFVSYFKTEAMGYKKSFRDLIFPMIKQRDENKNNDSNIHVFFYSDLQNKSERHNTMENVLTFLQFPIEDRARTACAFELAEDSRIHRNHSQPKSASGSFTYNSMVSHILQGQSPSARKRKDCEMFSIIRDFNTFFGFSCVPLRHLSEENRKHYATRPCQPKSG